MQASAPESHWWYIVAGTVASARHRNPVDKSVIVELRSTGQQTLVGPSIHPSGELYGALETESARVDAAHLAGCVAGLADAVVRARHGDGYDVGEHGPAGGPSGAEAEAAPPPLPNDAVERRAAAYLDAMPRAISGQGGHNATYAAATVMVHGFGLLCVLSRGGDESNSAPSAWTTTGSTAWSARWSRPRRG